MAKIYIGQTILSDDNTVKDQIIGAAPELLNTLDELAAALGDDQNYATSTATSLSNRLRIDTDAQALDATQLVNAKTNLGLENVTNESKATMFANPTFTGSITGTLGTAAQPNITSVGTLTDLDVSDNIILLNSGMTGSNAKDIGVIFERGTTGDNSAIVWDESADRFKFGTTTNAGTGDTASIDTTLGDIEAANLNLEGSIEANAITCQESLTGASLAINGTTLNVNDSESTVGIGIAAGSAYKLNVAGKVNVTNDLTVDTNILKVDATLNKVGIKHTPVAASADLHVNGSIIVANGTEKGLSIIPGAYQYNIGDIDDGENGTYLEIDSVNTFARLHGGGLAIGRALGSGKTLDVAGTAQIENLNVESNFQAEGDSLFDGTVEIADSMEFSGGGDLEFTSGGNISGSCDVDVTGSIQSSKWLRPGIYADATARDAAITSPAAGMMVFLTAGTKFQGYTGAAWVDLN